jgi:uncharacterized protein (DUF1697 family)
VTRHIALLRGINVGGRRPVDMAHLRALFAAMGFGDPRSLLRTGNMVFDCEAAGGATLERCVEAEAARRLRLDVDVLVRTAAQWRALIAANPYQDEAARDPAHLVAMCFKDPPRAAAVAALEKAIAGPEYLTVSGRNAYIMYPQGIGRSRLTHGLIERTLGTRGTGRNWNTVLKLGDMLTG